MAAAEGDVTALRAQLAALQSEVARLRSAGAPVPAGASDGDPLLHNMPHPPSAAALQAVRPLMTTKWNEPLAPVSGRELMHVETLYRAPDVHQRILAIADVFLDREVRNELQGVISQRTGAGNKLVELTFTMSEGQAAAGDPLFRERMQMNGVAAFYDWVYTIDIVCKAMDEYERRLKAIGTAQTNGKAFAVSRMETQDLDRVFFSPYAVPWWMMEDPAVAQILVPPAGETVTVAMKHDMDWVQFMRTSSTLAGATSTPSAAVCSEFFKPGAETVAYPNPLSKALTEKPAMDVTDFNIDGQTLTVEVKATGSPQTDLGLYKLLLGQYYLAAQEAVLLSSPMWNALIAIGDGLFRVCLSDAEFDLGVATVGRGDKIPPSSWINAFRGPPLNVVPEIDGSGNVTMHKYGDWTVTTTEKKASVGTMMPITQVALTYALMPRRVMSTVFDGNRQAGAALLALDDLSQAVWDKTGYVQRAITAFTNFKTNLPTVGTPPLALKGPEVTNATDLPKQDTDARVLAAAFLQPKILAPELYVAFGLRALFPPSERKRCADKQENAEKTDKLGEYLRQSQVHTGSGGAIGKYVLNGHTLSTGRFLLSRKPDDFKSTDMPAVMVVPSGGVTQCMNTLDTHPIRWCAKLRDAMSKVLLFDAAEQQRMRLDPGYRPTSAPRTLWEYLRARARDLQSVYGSYRDPTAQSGISPMATASHWFLGESSVTGGQSSVPRCPPNTLPRIWDTVNQHTVGVEDWKREIVTVNGRQMLPAHFKVEGCVPARDIAAITK